MSRRRFPLIASLVALAACSQSQDAEQTGNAPLAADNVAAAAESVPLLDGSGKEIGRVEIGEDANGVTLRLAANGISAGTHGVHLHTIGRCDGPKFESAGGHWNPENRQHGRDNPEGAHLGDLANISAGSDEATTVFLVGGVSRTGPGNALGDADGTSLVIHADADDYKTDPSGNSGGRIACAVLAAPTS
ncbi:superoxide dismutase family protein [Sphingomonas xanthus]|uniref:Superoxide dismutase family protein n=1 Tax=Sphingomonas xanthus TaxID=2594473 RepID=A0A516IPI8_9SPHN|nr:superoxide dismutase family protein [Sphingomonas xanthus]QDP18848.1 superoxide dismutase family protein [Sphingomonas xanthus]